MTHIKIKVIATSETQWNAIVEHAQVLGAVSRDNAYEYNADKPAMVVDNNYIKYSSPTMKSVAGVIPPLKISVNEFLGLSSLHDIANIGKPIDKQAISNAVAAVKKEMACAQGTLKVADCNVLVQGAVIFTTIGIPMLKSLGVEITTHDGVDYTIDIVSNTATEFTAESASAQAKADLIAGKVTTYTQWAKNCDLIENLTMTKVLPMV